nr:hypothetical protein Iba_scaffold247769CG0010 [Ipomoea batatas]GME13036.1 hypothetical protein Iba_scaffold14336CG0200 [Ipomoea batatas]GME18831.1 hypothetical protein Iba_scaffold21433CG0010 [Ipomoea batatas]
MNYTIIEHLNHYVGLRQVNAKRESRKAEGRIVGNKLLFPERSILPEKGEKAVNVCVLIGNNCP